MVMTELPRRAALALVVAASITSPAAAQTTAADPNHPEAALAQATPALGSGGAGGQGQSSQPGQPGTMPPGMMGRLMQAGGGMPMMGMHGHLLPNPGIPASSRLPSSTTLVASSRHPPSLTSPHR